MRHAPILTVALLAIVLMAGPPLTAQESASYKLKEHSFNAGGHPAGGVIPTSAGYRMTLDVIGEGCVMTGASSASYRLDSSFAAAYPPPGEVAGLWFSDHQSLHWNPEKSTGSYNLYSDLISLLSGGGYGDCDQQDLAETAATIGGDPPADDGYFYLVTARNRLDEEGIKGADSDGAVRPNDSPCP